MRSGNIFVRGTAWIGCTQRGVLSQDLRDAYRAPYHNWHRRLAVLRFVQDIPLGKKDRAWRTVQHVENTLPELRKRVPAMLAWGGQDPVFDSHFLREWKERWPEIQLVHYPDSGHYILEDQRADLLPRIEHFLRNSQLPPVS